MDYRSLPGDPSLGPAASGLRYREPLGLPTLALALLITSYFYCLPLGRYSMGGLASDIRIYDFVFIGFLFAVGLAKMPRVRRLWRDRFNYHRWAGLLVILVWVSLVLTFGLGSSTKVLPSIIRAFRFTAYLLSATFVVAIADSPRRWRFLLAVFFINCAIQAALAFLQGLKLLPNLWPSYWVDNYGNLPVGTLSPHHKQIGVVMLLGITLTANLYRRSRLFHMRILVLLLLAMMLMVIIFAGARTAWLGVGAFGLAYLCMHRGKALLIVPTLLLGLGVVFWFGRDWVRDPLETQIRARLIDRVNRFGFEGVAGERTRIYALDYPRAVQSNPLILLVGAGFENISTYLGATGAHNNYFQAWFELGLVGLIVYLKLLAGVLRALRCTARRAASEPERLLAKDVWAAFVGILATMMVGETLWAQYSMFTLTGQIMVLVGLATCPLNWATSTRGDRRPYVGTVHPRS